MKLKLQKCVRFGRTIAVGALLVLGIVATTRCIKASLTAYNGVHKTLNENKEES